MKHKDDCDKCKPPPTFMRLTPMTQHTGYDTFTITDTGSPVSDTRKKAPPRKPKLDCLETINIACASVLLLVWAPLSIFIFIKVFQSISLDQYT